MPKQVFFACFELVLARFGSPKMPKCLENGLSLGQQMVQKWVKNVLFHKLSQTIWGA